MAKRAKPEVIFSIDEFGDEIARIPISNRSGQFCRMDRTDWEEWCAAGRSQALYVQPLGPGRFGLAFCDRLDRGTSGPATVARTIMNPPKGKVVWRKSPDILDMRRRNLVLRNRLVKAPVDV